MRVVRTLIVTLFVIAAGCGGGDDPAERGRKVYAANCTACHNPDPRRDGVLGPATAGSSRELLEARILRAAYPDGYAPRRETQQMAALPYLAPEIDALAAYLIAVD